MKIPYISCFTSQCITLKQKGRYQSGSVPCEYKSFAIALEPRDLMNHIHESVLRAFTRSTMYVLSTKYNLVKLI